jgi:hypothetical protein
MNHDGYLIKPQALAPNSAPSSYTTLRDTIKYGKRLWTFEDNPWLLRQRPYA